jgi:hypothetical protein
MKTELAVIRRDHPAMLKDPKNQLAIARLFFWNAEYPEAWRMARDLAMAEEPLPQTWVLIGDLFSYTQKMKNIGQAPIYNSIREFLAGQGKKIANVTILQPILGDVLYPQMNLAKLATLEEDRTPASVPQKKGYELKARVEAIARTLQALDKQQAVLKAYAQSPAAQVAVAGLCASPLLKREAIRRLDLYKRDPIASPQWKEFVSRVDMKIRELEGIARQEQGSCEQQRQVIAYMKPSQEIISPLCNEYSCYPTVPGKIEDVLAYEEERRHAPSTRLDQIHKYLAIGAWAPAEVTAYTSNSPKERTMLLAFMRLAMGDTWNAAPLLKEAASDPAQAPHANLMLAAIAWRHGHLKLAADQLRRIRQDAKLLDWEEKIFDQVRSAAGQFLGEANEPARPSAS